MAKIDGVPTLAGWIDYLQLVAFMGLFGAIAALAFWMIFRRRQQAGQRPVPPSATKGNMDFS